jgi:hypothetical protein
VKILPDAFFAVEMPPRFVILFDLTSDDEGGREEEKKRQ